MNNLSEEELRLDLLVSVTEERGYAVDELESIIKLAKDDNKKNKSRNVFKNTFNNTNQLKQLSINKIKYIQEASVIELDILLDMLNYDGKLILPELYSKLIKSVDISDGDCSYKFSKYFEIHNDRVNFERMEMPLEETLDLKDYLLKSILDSRFILNALNKEVQAKKEKLNMLKSVDKAQVENSIDFDNIMKELERGILEYEGPLKEFTTLKDITKLYHFIKSAIDMPITNKHLNFFESMPFVSALDIKLFHYYSIQVDQKIKEKELKALKKQEMNKVKIEPKKIDVEENVKPVYIEFDDEEIIYDDKISDESNLIYKNLLSGNSLDDIKELLPTYNKKKYFKIKYDLLKLLSEEIEVAVDLVNSENDLDLHVYLSNLNNVNKLVGLYFENEEKPLLEEVDSDITVRNLFFAETTTDSAIINRDIKNLPPEDVRKVKKILEMAVSEHQELVVDKYKKIRDYKQIWELKYDNMRLAFAPLNKDTIFILGVYIKKDDRDLSIIKSMANRSKSSIEQYLELKDYIKSGTMPDNVFNKHVDLYHETLKLCEKYEKVRQIKTKN